MTKHTGVAGSRHRGWKGTQQTVRSAGLDHPLPTTRLFHGLSIAKLNLNTQELSERLTWLVHELTLMAWNTTAIDE